MKRITSQESFVQEYTALLDAINKSIANLAQYQMIEDGQRDTLVTEKINRLKLHRKKLEDLLAYYSRAPHHEWMYTKDKIKRVFTAARAELIKPAPAGNTPTDL
ncbi:MAG: hypothetical protein R3301_07030 [Saprospiraceae bacterium]|nr:hypothetical protein [Saprospiraceae bacterium]